MWTPTNQLCIHYKHEDFYVANMKHRRVVVVTFGCEEPLTAAS